MHAQHEVRIGERAYRIDYTITGDEYLLCIELDGYAYHRDRSAFNYDRMRQNDLTSAGRTVLRFSYDSIRSETARCVAQLQAVLAQDSALSRFVVGAPTIETPQMDPNPTHAFAPMGSKWREPYAVNSYFDTVRDRLNWQTLRQCQNQAFLALANYYRTGGQNAACVMSVGAGKTALGVVACLAFARRRALIVTPGSVIRGTFHKAFDHEAIGNVLYGLPGGPLIPGSVPPNVLTLDR